MKPLHIALLVAAGAVGGAVVMKITQRPPAPVVAQTIAPPPVAAPPVVPPPVVPPPAPPVAVKTAPPLPFEAPKEVTKTPKAVRDVPKPLRETPKVASAAQKPVRAPSQKEFHLDARVWTSKQPSEPRISAKVLISTPNSAPEPAESAPAPQTIPPARTEPEYVTPPPAPPEPHRVTLNAGTLIPVRLVDGLSAERNLPGDAFMATLQNELVVDGFVIAERGARVEGRVVASDRGGRVKGVSSLQVELVRLHLSDGQAVVVQTDAFDRRSEATHNEDAAKVGGGAAIGAIIGAAAGGGKGAAIGAGVGGAAGVGDVMATRGRPAELRSETRVTFRLRAPVTITEKLRE